MSVETAVAGLALNAGGQLMAGQSAANSASYGAEVARQNAALAKLNAGYARDSAARQLVRGEFQQSENDLKVGQTLGAQLSAMGASGLDVSSGSFRRVQESTYRLGRADSLQIRENANIDYFNDMVRAANFENQQNMFEREGQFLDQTADNALLSSWINTGSSLLGGATSIKKSYPQSFGSF